MTKLSPATLATFTALTLVLAAPGLALAKTAPKTIAKTLAKSLVKAVTPKVTTTTGSTVAENGGISANGVGTWTKTVTNYGNGHATVVTTTTYSDGVQVTVTGNINTVKLADGAKVTTDDATIVTKNGSTTKTATVDTTDTSTTNAAVTDVSKDITNANGKSYDLDGTVTQSTITGGTQRVIDLTNTTTKKAEDLTADTFKAGNAVATEITGTGFNGKAVNAASLTTTNGVASGNYIDNSGSGQGSYSKTVTPTQTGRTVDDTITFANGRVTNVDDTYTNVAKGVTNLNSISSSTANGVTTSSVDNLTYTTDANGQQISGSFANTSGQYGSVAGQNTTTNYGHSVTETLTNQTGQTQTVITDGLVLNGASFNVSNGTSFANKPITNAALYTN